ncbi:uncharacterized protein JN550_001717 [Neoarthrinium moseri]|uniref:uncharacterized protein n=1 Tax=Neoarthrinium moseri TaxID=1658444 RepID=UPI001FDDB496|nr:uncharacterized protein JN550_001717 [Neoarthrinium moseri]KAI1876221.1 hypothetical protein JN550_001717 [Neoarthrinium moseri]
MDRYSNLEVHYNQDPNNAANPQSQHPSPDHSSFPEVVPAADQHKEAAVTPDPQGQSQKEYIPAANLAPEVVASHQHQYYNSVPQNEAAWQNTDGHAAAAAPERRICGLRRRTFFIALAVAIVVVIGVVVGAVAGVLTSRQKSASGPDNPDSPPSSTNVNVMDVSSLTASNWTDSKGFTHRAVFFQDPANALIGRRWDSQNRTWATTNVTAVMANSATHLDPAPGTALASAALDWPNAYQVRVHFLDRSDLVRTTFADDPVNWPDRWKNDTMKDAKLQTIHASRLAAAWERCADKNCVGVWTVAYQGPKGAINVANYTDWTTSTVVLDSNVVTGNTALALVPQYRGTQDNMGLLSQSYSSGTMGSLQVTAYDNKTWTKKTAEIIPDLPLPAESQHVAVTKWGSWSKTLSYTSMADGTVKGSWWDGPQGSTVNALSSIRFDGGPATANFSAIAATLDAMFYGIMGDEVHEYSVDSSDAATLHYVGRVYP